MEINKKITIQDLKEKKACKKGIDWFKENFGEETNINTLKNELIKQKEYNYLWWVYEEFKLTGEYICFYDNGQIYEKCFFKDGKVEGEYISFYENENVFEKCFFKDDKVEGECIKFYEDGEVFIKGFYKDGKRDGIRTFYKLDSSIYCEEKYNNGELIEIKYY
jgi:antitoxin component YwqK of YwqJK toxin-antitoxin module